jgi:hypothetical protein
MYKKYESRFNVIRKTKHLKKILLKRTEEILFSIYKDLPNRWGMNEEGLIGVFDYSADENKYVWSCLNRLNTNYSMLAYIFHLLKEEDVVLNFELDPSKNLGRSTIRLNLFFDELEKRKMSILFDGKIKNELWEIADMVWKKGVAHSVNVRENVKLYFPGSIGADENDETPGKAADTKKGIDKIIYYPDDVKKTAQIKGCWKVTHEDGKYYVYCSVEEDAYRRIDFYVFITGGENNVYVFKNDMNKTSTFVDNRGKPVITLDEELLVYYGEKILYD